MLGLKNRRSGIFSHRSYAGSSISSVHRSVLMTMLHTTTAAAAVAVTSAVAAEEIHQQEQCFIFLMNMLYHLQANSEGSSDYVHTLSPHRALAVHMHTYIEVAYSPSESFTWT